MSIYNGKNIVILGMGLTGFSCLKFFISLGIYPRVIDCNINFNSKIFIPTNIECCFGYLKKKWVLEADLIIISPGFNSYSNVILEAKKRGIEIINDIEIFCRIVKSNIIAVTGTNGKTTVVSMLYKIMKKSGFNVSLGGNIGIPVLDLLNHKSDFYILELSSFQLEYISTLNFFCAGILNISEDHMDRYPNGIRDYIFSKFKIFSKSKYCIINFSDVYSKPYNLFEMNVVSFGTDYSDYYFKRNNKSINLFYLNNKFFRIKNYFFKSITNFLNILFVISITDILKIPRKMVFKILLNFKNLPHRFNILGNKKNILWINDSKSTNISSTILALQNLSLFDKISKIWLILGGDGKLSDFENLLKPYLLKLRKLRICCFGKSKDVLYNLIPNISYKFSSLYCVVKYITNCAGNGDIILLSPSCSSTDQFLNFEDRGNVFINLYNKYNNICKKNIFYEKK